MKIISEKERPDMIFRHENRDGKISYSICISTKLQNGSYLKDYMPVRFAKNVDVENKCLIEITDAWLGVFETRDKQKVKYIFINKFNKVTGYVSTQNSTNIPKTQNTFVSDYKTPLAITEDELPF